MTEKKRATRRKKADPEPRDPDVTLASEVKVSATEWIFKPWVARGQLTLVVGLPAVGKSTFVAWLLSTATRPTILPGREEMLGSSAIPRWVENGVNLGDVGILNNRDYYFPRDTERVIKIMQGRGSSILILDPVDSYFNPDGSENDGACVREFLESLSRIGSSTGAGVVGVRHPGKDPTNPLPGSRSWRAVPRSILLLARDEEQEESYQVRHFKDSNGTGSLPMRYNLVASEPTRPRVWKWGEAVSKDREQLARVAEGPAIRAKVLEACQLLYHLFSHEEDPSAQELVEQCRKLGIGEHARDEAKRLLGIRSRPNGVGSTWVLFRTRETWPDWLEGQKQAGGGVSL